MKKKHKIFTVVITSLVTTILLMALTACSHTFTCGVCHQEKTGNSHKTQILGQEIEICDDCYNLGNNIANGLLGN
ncbi:MAG: hypothetical protein ACI4XP_10510 [Acutalibacteraceae bacterium]